MDFTINKNLTDINYTQGNKSRIKYIVIHYTANDGDTAYANTVYFKSVNRGASAHYFADEKSVWQCVEDKDIAWHCGTTGKYYHDECRNSNSIGVELCSKKDSAGKYYIDDRTINTAVELVSYLMELYNVGIDNVLRHYDVTHKNCPAPFVEDESQWTAFKDRLIRKEEEEVVEAITMTINGKNYIINRILKDDKNYIALSELQGAGFDVGYDSETKIPSLDNRLSEISINVDGEDKSVEGLNLKGYNYCKLRDIEEAVGSFSIGYSGSKIEITTLCTAEEEKAENDENSEE
ncbi:MAG: N-acetylmuramoyl-L-alanine amidase [Clostridiales bacterium]|nr:N-acetylmuramoyl-L-alanine amidase [Clostridiales bacterium]